RKAPLWKGEGLTSPDDVRISVEFNSGAISLLEYSEYKGGGIHALGIKMEDGTVVDPTPQNIANGSYPLTRPPLLYTNNVPTGTLRKVINFMLSPDGQAYVHAVGHVSNDDLRPDKK